MRVLDFNVRPFLKNPSLMHSGTSDASISENRLVTTPSRIEANAMFGEDVVTRLPYRTLSRIGPVQYSGIMIDEERLVGLKVRDQLNIMPKIY
jgi:hypothetical protein